MEAFVMLPRLYTKSMDTSRNGLGFFNKVIKCPVTEVENNEYTLELEIAPTDRFVNVVAPDMLIKAKPNHSDPPQLFEVNTADFSNNGKSFVIKGTHIKSYFFNNLIRGTLTVSDLTGTAATVVENICRNVLLHRPSNNISYQNVILIGYDNTVGTVDVDLTKPLTLEELFFGEGGVIDTFGGTFKYDNDRIYLMKNRGRDADRIIRYGSGISDYTQSISNADTYTHIIGYARFTAQNADTFVYGNLIETGKAIPTSFYKNVLPIDFTDKFRNGSYDPINDQNAIATRLTTLTQRHLTANLSKLKEPTVNIRVTEQSELKRLKDVGLCDGVKVAYSVLGLSLRGKVVKTVYDSVLERYIEHEIGERKLSLSDLIKKSTRR